MKERTQGEIVADDQNQDKAPRDESSVIAAAAATATQEVAVAAGDAARPQPSSSTRTQTRRSRRRPRARAGAGARIDGSREALPSPPPSNHSSRPRPPSGSGVPPWRGNTTTTPMGEIQHNGQGINGDNKPLGGDPDDRGADNDEKEENHGPSTNDGSGGSDTRATKANNDTANSNANANATYSGGNTNSNGINGLTSSTSLDELRVAYERLDLDGNGPNHNGGASSASIPPWRNEELPTSQSGAVTTRPTLILRRPAVEQPAAVLAERSTVNGGGGHYGHDTPTPNGINTSADADTTATSTPTAIDPTPPPNAPRGPRRWLRRQGLDFPSNGNGNGARSRSANHPSSSSMGTRAGREPTPTYTQQRRPSSSPPSNSQPQPRGTRARGLDSQHAPAVQQSHAAVTNSRPPRETSTSCEGSDSNWHRPLPHRPRRYNFTSSSSDRPAVPPTPPQSPEDDNDSGNSSNDIVTHSVDVPSIPAVTNGTDPHPSPWWSNGGGAGSAEDSGDTNGSGVQNDNDDNYDDDDALYSPQEWGVENGTEVHNPRPGEQEDNWGYFPGSDGDIYYHNPHSDWLSEPGQVGGVGVSAAGPSRGYLQEQQQQHQQQQYQQQSSFAPPFNPHAPQGSFHPADGTPLPSHYVTYASRQERFEDEPPNWPPFQHPPEPPYPPPHQQHTHQDPHPHNTNFYQSPYHEPHMTAPEEFYYPPSPQPSYPPLRPPPPPPPQPQPQPQATSLSSLVEASEPEPQTPNDPGFAENQANLTWARNGVFGYVGLKELTPSVPV